MRNLNGIKPQDVVVMLQLLAKPGMSQMELASSLEISQAEISHGLKRLKHSALINSQGFPNLEASLEFLVHAVKYVFPAQLSAPAAGIPTSFAHPEFKFVKYNSDSIHVWPHPNGKVRGIALLPIYETLPQACLKDKNLYKIAALMEMIRSGRAREKQIGADELRKFLEKMNAK